MKYYGMARQSVKDNYLHTVNNICKSVQDRLKNLKDSPIFKNMETILDTFSWPISGDAGAFGNLQIIEMCEHFKGLLQDNDCDISKVNVEWLTLKSYIIPLVQNQDVTMNYLEIWKEGFSKRLFEVGICECSAFI